MKDSIQNKINRIQEIALASGTKKNIIDNNVTELSNNIICQKLLEMLKKLNYFFLN